ncbi:MAG TPA: PD-(D/E)XK nuclease family protein, partial [Polyangiaceae bacterium]|nr:PD-(D/E)XK nuclease family protein [Polyangiaceae bacterium]
MADLSPNASVDDYSPSHLARFAQCPRSYQLHHVERLPADVAPERTFGVVLHRALEDTVREHAEARRQGVLDADFAAQAYRDAWAGSGLRDHALFVEGLELVRRWVAREGAVDAGQVVGVEQPFTLHFDGVALRGTMNRVDRIGDDAILIRDYRSTRLPPRREDVEESLPLALYDLAARQLWPWARRVELGFDLLRHDVVVRAERTPAQREATRQYVLATVAQIRRGDDAPRPSTLCPRCDHRTQCLAYAAARAGHREHAGADPDDLPAVAREREELAVLLKVLGGRKDDLDDVLRAELDHEPELRLEGRRYALGVAVRKEYPLERTLTVLEEAGIAR